MSKFKVGDKVLIKASKSNESKKYNGEIREVIMDYGSNFFSTDSNMGGMWDDEATLVKKKINNNSWGF